MDFKERILDIHRLMLLNLDSEFDKSVGSWAYDILMPPSKELIELKELLGTVDSKRDIENLTGSDLDKFIKQITPITRRLATYATGHVIITGNTETEIPAGTVVASASYEYQTTEYAVIDMSGEVNIPVISTVSGKRGNAEKNTINRFPVVIPGLETVSNPIAIYGGFDEESDETLRERYYEYINKPATSGNIYHYIQWANEIQGVGTARVTPLWDGLNTVKIVLIDLNGQPASIDLVEEVQEYIDPKGEKVDGVFDKWGKGYGQAPIGAFCTIEAAEKLNIEVKADIILDGTVGMPDIVAEFRERMVERFSVIALNGGSPIISIAQIGRLILELEGVIDYDSQSLTLNDTKENIVLTDQEVPVFKGVTFNEITQ